MKETCYQYWPKSGMVEFGEYAIDLMEERAVMGFFIRKLSLYDVKVAHLSAENEWHIVFYLCARLAAPTRLFSYT